MLSFFFFVVSFLTILLISFPSSAGEDRYVLVGNKKVPKNLNKLYWDYCINRADKKVKDFLDDTTITKYSSDLETKFRKQFGKALIQNTSEFSVFGKDSSISINLGGSTHDCPPTASSFDGTFETKNDKTYKFELSVGDTEDFHYKIYDLVFTPYEQVQKGIKPQEVNCRQGLELHIKHEGVDKPLCIESTTYDKLVKWGYFR